MNCELRIANYELRIDRVTITPSYSLMKMMPSEHIINEGLKVMNAQLSRRLGKVWLEVEQRLSMDEVDRFVELALQANSFDELPDSLKNLVLEIEAESKEKAA